MKMNDDTNLDVMKRLRCPPWFSSYFLNIGLFRNVRLRMLQYYKQMFYLARKTAHVESANGIESSPDQPRKFCAQSSNSAVGSCSASPLPAEGALTLSDLQHAGFEHGAHVAS